MSDDMLLRAEDDPAVRYMPTPEQIAAACADIRAGWDPYTEQQRRPQNGSHDYGEPVRTVNY